MKSISRKITNIFITHKAGAWGSAANGRKPMGYFFGNRVTR